MKPFLEFLRIEMSLFARSRLAVFWSLAFPLLLLAAQMALFGRGPSLGPVRLALVDADRSPAAEAYLDFLARALAGQTSVRAVVARLEVLPSPRGYDLAVVVPAGFAQARREGRTGEAELRTGAGGPAAAVAASMLRGITDAYDLAAVRTPRAVALRLPAEGAPAPGFSYGLYVLTGLSVMVILSTSLMGFAHPLVAAREGGLLRLYQVFPVAPSRVLAAWLLARITLSLLSTLVLAAVAVAIYRVPIVPAPAGLALALAGLAVGSAAFLSLGLAVAALAPNVAGVTMLCNLVYFPLLFSGNLLLPTGNLPGFLQRLLEFLPVNALVGSLRRCLSGGADPAREAATLGALAAAAALCLVLAGRRFAWTPREQA